MSTPSRPARGQVRANYYRTADFIREFEKVVTWVTPGPGPSFLGRPAPAGLRRNDLPVAPNAACRSAIGYARGLGFEPHADFVKAAGHLGEWDGVCDLEFGRDGMPMYIEGPHDDTWRITHTLRQNVGDGNFHYLVGMRS